MIGEQPNKYITSLSEHTCPSGKLFFYFFCEACLTRSRYMPLFSPGFPIRDSSERSSREGLLRGESQQVET